MGVRNPVGDYPSLLAVCCRLHVPGSDRPATLPYQVCLEKNVLEIPSSIRLFMCVTYGGFKGNIGRICKYLCMCVRENTYLPLYTEAEFLDEIQTQVILLALHRYLYSFALRFLFLQTHSTSYVFLHTHATYYVFLQFSYCTL